MEPDDRAKARIPALNEEIHTIYFADRRYWERGQAATLEERAEYQRRQDRLEEIRKELALLRSAWTEAETQPRGEPLDAVCTGTTTVEPPDATIAAELKAGWAPPVVEGEI